MQINKKIIIICTLLILTVFTIIGSVNASDSLNETSNIMHETNMDNSQTSISDTNPKYDHTSNDDNTNFKEDSASNSKLEKENTKQTVSSINTDKLRTNQNNQNKLTEDPTTVIYAAHNGTSDKDGKTKENATSLSNALLISQNGTTINLINGIYKPGDLGTISEKKINITGEGEVILDGDTNNRIFFIGTDSEVTLKNLIMINGYTPSSTDSSGALLANSGKLTIINCTFANSTSEKNGGAIYNAADLIVINSTFSNNNAEGHGGAIYNHDPGVSPTTSLTIDNCIFKDNTVNGKSKDGSKYGGGAIFIQNMGPATIRNTLFENNKANEYGGGAIEISQTSNVYINNCSFINNCLNGESEDYDDYGGGAISFRGRGGAPHNNLTIDNSLFINNTAKNYDGGAIYNIYLTVTLKNSAIINNTDTNGYSIYLRKTSGYPNTAKVIANDNWWGSNDKPKSETNGATIDRWIILTITNQSEIKPGETAKIVVSLNNYTTGTMNKTLTNPMTIERPVTLYTNLGNIEGKLVNGEFIIPYTITSDLRIISTRVDNEEQVLFVITIPTSLELTNITSHMGNRIEYTVKVTNGNTTINKGNVEIYFDDDLAAIIPVNNGEAKGIIMINKNIGNHTITAKYIDLTKEFEDTEKNATLNVNGIDNIVTKETFNNFFDEGNNLKTDIPFDEIFFKGPIENKIINITKKIILTGNNTLFNNTILNILANNVKINNINFIANQNFDDGAIIYSFGQNTIIENNTISYTAPNTSNSYVLYFEYASKSEIINNTITYIAGLGEDIQTIPVYIQNSARLLIKDNIFDIKIPSIAIANYGVAPYYYGTLNSAGLVLETCEKLILDNNTINIKYNGFDEYIDTINGVHIKFCDDSKITNNNIQLKGHSYSYPLYIDGSERVEISKNNILGESELDQTNALSINGKTSATITNNNITATADIVVYPIWLNDLTYKSKATLTNNTINGKANIVYGIYAEENSTKIINNTIEANGNYTIGITSYKTDIIIKNNTIDSKGTNTGNGIRPQGIIPVETTAITISNTTNMEIINNKLTSTGNYTIDILSSTGNISDNNLRLTNSTIGDATIKQSDSNLTIDNNKTSKLDPVIPLNPDTPPKPTNDTTVNPSTQNEDKTTTTTTTKTTKTTTTPKQIIIAKNLKVKKTAKQVKIKATLKKINNKTLKNKKLTLKLNGKTYKAKTNKKGTATFKIPKKAIKKLKTGKTYKYTIKYGKYKITKKITIKK